jgi:ribosomal protein S27AE
MKKEFITSTLVLLCPQCGSDQFVNAEHINPESQATCGACGHTTQASTLMATARDKKALELAVEAARATFGKLLK